MGITGFGVPSGGSHDAGNDDDEFQGFGIPSADSGEGGGGLENPIGVFDARCIGPKSITAKDSGRRYLALEFELVGGEFDGEQYSLMAEAITSDDDRAAKKKKLRGWQRLADACKAMGLAVDPRTLIPLDGWAATEGQTCRLAVSTYDKAGTDNPTIVWGKPKSRQRDGVEVGFPRELADDRGKFRDYGCGVLPPE